MDKITKTRKFLKGLQDLEGVVTESSLKEIPDDIKSSPLMDSLKVISDEEAESAEGVIVPLVTDPLYLPDNLVGECSLCGKKVQFRPTSPKKPRKICMDCVADGALNNRS